MLLLCSFLPDTYQVWQGVLQAEPKPTWKPAQGALPRMPSPRALEAQTSSQRRRLESSRAARPAPKLQAAWRPSQIVQGAGQSRVRGVVSCNGKNVCAFPLPQHTFPGDLPPRVGQTRSVRRGQGAVLEPEVGRNDP